MPGDTIVLLDRLNADRTDCLVPDGLRRDARDGLRRHVPTASSGHFFSAFLLPTLVAFGVVLPLTRPVAALTGTNRGAADRTEPVAARVESLLAARHDHVIRPEPIAAPRAGRHSRVVVGSVVGPGLVDQRRQERSDRGGSIPALAVTAHRDDYSVEQATAAGFQAFLPKPVDPFDLCRTVALLVGR